MFKRRCKITLDGKLPEGVKKDLAAEIPRHKDKWVVFTLEPINTRSNNQNSFYWAAVVPMVRDKLIEYGNSVDDEDTHEFLKKTGKLTRVIITPDEQVKTLMTTKKLSKAEFEQYLDNIRIWGAEHGLAIPFPNEHIYGI
jgi:hypothetical protein